MLKGIPKIISPDLMKVLLEMGHGDELVLADGNFPAASHARRLIRSDGHGIPEILEAILLFLPLDTFVDNPALLMSVVPGDETKPEIWDTYRKIILKSGYNLKEFEFMDRFAFYERAKQAYAIVSAGEQALYANIILKKGLVT